MNTLSREIQGKKRQVPRSLGAIIFALDAFALWFAFFVTSHLSGVMVFMSDNFGWDYDFNHFDTRRYYYIFLCFFIVLRFALKGHYSRRMPWVGQVESIIKTVGFAALFDCFNYYFLNYASFPSWIVINWFLCTLFVIVARQVSISIIRRSSQWRLPIALVGNSRMILDCLHAFAGEKFTGYEVKAILLTDDPAPFKTESLPAGLTLPELRQDAENFDRFIKQNRGYYYIFALDELRGPRAAALTSAIEISQIEYGIVPHTRALDIYGMEPHYFFGNDVMILHRRDSIRSPSGRVMKRLLDIGATGAAMPFLGIFALIVWTMKKIQKSKTPVFYGGERVGMNGKTFNCWKFCTMRPNADEILNSILEKDEEARAEWEKFQKLKDDPRVDSSISKFLRKTSLDELPQLWNVFVGDMSLVGPRPILESQREDYGDMLEQYSAVRPGITGLWQVSGRNETTFQQRIYWDGWYIRNWSLWYDIVIIFKTVRVLLTRSGAY